MKKYWTELRNLAEEAMSKAQKTYAKSYVKKWRKVKYKLESFMLVHKPASEVDLAKKLMHFY